MKRIRSLGAFVFAMAVFASIAPWTNAYADDPYIDVSTKGVSQSSAIETVSGQMYYKTYVNPSLSHDSGSWWKSVWNKITLNEDGYIFASGTPQYSVGYAIYDESSHQLDKGSFSRSNDKPLYFGLKAGTYYIEFTMGSYSQNSFLYSIYINEGVVCETEPNDTFSEASAMNVGQKWLGFASASESYNPDYYSISLSAGKTYRFIVDGYEKIGRPSFYLYDSDRLTNSNLSRSLKYDATLDKYVCEFKCNQSGVHYIFAKVGNSFESLVYGLEVQETASSDDSSAGNSGIVDNKNFFYTVSGNCATITGYGGALETISIPAELDGYPVVAIGNSAFSNNTKVKEITLPSTIVSIGEYAFCGCSSLTRINLPDGMETIDYCAFNGCSSLAELVIPTSLHTFGHYAFDGLAYPSKIYLFDGGPWDQYGLLSDNPSLFFDSSRTTLILTSNPEYGMGIWRSFPDVSQEVIKAGGPDKIWYTADGWLDYVVEANLMGGYASNGWFGPYDNITRGQVATILYRAECAKDSSLIGKFGSTTDPSSYARTCAFEDMQACSYYTAAINWAKSAGIMTGDSATNCTTVRPDDSVARQELCLMLARYANGGVVPETELDASAASGILDMNEVASWAKNGVIWAVNNGVISGVDNGDGTYSIDPDGKTWRSAAAKMFTVVMRDIR